ncbi:unnamed protein product [Larinioides sclopetarius]|uniref:Uncharacterized protein n=1 Tax=Larinioides sclopetarius TaxID=280406 RepID=A0AAV2C0C2_9ARAC
MSSVTHEMKIISLFSMNILICMDYPSCFSTFQPTVSHIFFEVKNPQVTIIRHVPLYGSGEIFSHVGGLLGCWLGISVFTFTDILEKFVQKVAIGKKGCGKLKKKKAPTS